MPILAERWIEAGKRKQDKVRNAFPPASATEGL